MHETNRKIGVLVLLLLCVTALTPLYAAKDKNVRPIVKSWRLMYDYGLVDTTQVDTSWLNVPCRSLNNDYSIANAYNGNAISPIQSMIYFDRDGNGMRNGLYRPRMDNIFGMSYSPYVLTPVDVNFYHTTIAYSGVSWQKGFTTGHQDADITFHFTGNLNKKTNLGAQLHYVNAPGLYANQQGKLFNGAIFGSYDGDHYGLAASVMYSGISNFENGGLASPDEINGKLEAEDIPTNMHAMSGYKYVAGYLNHHYSICVERERKQTIRKRGQEPRDTTIIEYVPVTTFAHTFAVTNHMKRYIEKTAQQGFYENTYLNMSSTRDTANALAIRNTLAVTFEEEFNTLLHFGATVYATNEFLHYQTRAGQYKPITPAGFGKADYDNIVAQKLHWMADTIIGEKWTNNTLVGGALYKNRGKWVRYGFGGDVCLAGYKLGEFQVNGHVNGTFPIGKDTLTVNAQAYFRNETPDYFLQHYRSNHFIWDNEFDKTYRFFVGGEVRYPTKWFKPGVFVGFENLTKYIYFNSRGLPQQHTGNVQVLEVNGQLDLTTPWVNLENHVVWQMSSDTVLAVPAIALYHNLYYHGLWFRALYAQIGIDMRYHTKYYAPVLNPATGQFMAQHQEKVGNYMIMNAYLNLYVKSIRLKLFLQYTHFNYFMTRNKAYFSMPAYAENPPVFRLGAAWHFWR